MTERLKGFIVSLDHDMREDDAERVIAAIRMMLLKKVSSFSEATRVKPQSRTTKVCAPCAAATLIGTFATTPPSTSLRPSRSM